jgi:hypothetical protein
VLSLKIESSPFHLKISIKGRMNNSTEIRPNFKDGILRTLYHQKKQQIMKRIHTIITDFAAIGLKTQKNTQLIAVTQENFVKT